MKISTNSLFIGLFLLISLSLLHLGGFAQPLNGTYTIGATGADYVNFSAAVSDMQSRSINGPVVFNVANGTYSDRIYISQISGASASNTITFNGASRTGVILQYTGYYNLKAVVTFNGADYVTIKNMTIQNLGTTDAWGVLFKTGSNYNQIENCDININDQNTNGYLCGIVFSGYDNYYYNCNNANNNKILSCSINGGYYGVYSLGYNYNPSTDLLTDNEFNNCIFEKQYNYGIHYDLNLSLKIQSCTFNNFRSTSAYAIYGYRSTASIIDKNSIQNCRYGIQLGYENYYSSSTGSYITNNLIYGFPDINYQWGIYLYNGYYINILHNNIELNTQNSTYNSYPYSCVYLNNCYSHVIKNNIFSSLGIYGGYLFSQYSSSNIQLDYNDYYYPNATSNYNRFFSNGSYYIDFNNFKSNTSGFLNGVHDQNSFDNINPNFVSSSDLHLDFNNPPNTFAPVISGVSQINTDIDGDARPASGLTFIGADNQAGFNAYVFVSDHNGYNISCNGGADGSIDLAVWGGTPGYTYSWSNNATTQDLSNLTAGTYTVIVTDAANSQITRSITLTEPQALVVSKTLKTYAGGYNTSCKSNCDGEVTLSVTGGVPPYRGTGFGFSEDFTGTTIDQNKFVLAAPNNSVFSQNGELHITNSGSNYYWRNFFYSSEKFERVVGRTFEFRAKSNNSPTMVGFMKETPNVNNSSGYQEIVHALYVYGNTLYVYEYGNYRGNFGSIPAGYNDFKIELLATGAKYYMNGNLVYTSNSYSDQYMRVGLCDYDSMSFS